jgi:hypothetical protein
VDNHRLPGLAARKTKKVLKRPHVRWGCVVYRV